MGIKLEEDWEDVVAVVGCPDRKIHYHRFFPELEKEDLLFRVGGMKRNESKFTVDYRTLNLATQRVENFSGQRIHNSEPLKAPPPREEAPRIQIHSHIPHELIPGAQR